jgi:hypothetical protein
LRKSEHHINCLHKEFLEVRVKNSLRRAHEF